MDPFSLVVSVANLLALVDNAYRGVQFVRRAFTDPKTDALYVRLITEKARHAEWRRRMGISTEEDTQTLLSKLPTDAKESLAVIIKPFERHLKASDALFAKYGVSKPGTFDQKISVRDRFRRLDLLIDGQRELGNLLDALKACNDGLILIAPPPPGYYVSAANNDMILESSQPGQLSESSQQHESLDWSDLRRGVVYPNGHDQHQVKEKKVFRPLIELLHSTALTVLRDLLPKYPKERALFEPPALRLALWGSGMFRGFVTIDQALDQQSSAIILLKENICGILADVAITIEHTLNHLGEPSDSMSLLKLKELFAFKEIARLPLKGLDEDYEALETTSSQSTVLETTDSKIENVIGHNYEGDEAENIYNGLSQLTKGFGTPDFEISLLEDDIDQNKKVLGVGYYARELALLIECLFSTLSTVEMVILTTVKTQRLNSGLDEREMILSKSQSDISLSKMVAGPVKRLLEVDLELVAAMRESLKDTKYAKSLEHESLGLDVKKLDKDLHEASAQMKYWTGKLQENSQDTTVDTNTATAMHLARIASTFSSSFTPVKPRKDLDPEKIQALIRQCLAGLPQEASGPSSVDASPETTSVPPKVSTSVALNLLKESNLKLRSLAGSKAPQASYLSDFKVSYPQDPKEGGEWKARQLSVAKETELGGKTPIGTPSPYSSTSIM